MAGEAKESLWACPAAELPAWLRIPMVCSRAPVGARSDEFRSHTVPAAQGRCLAVVLAGRLPWERSVLPLTQRPHPPDR